MSEFNRWIKYILFGIPGKIGCCLRNKVLPYQNGEEVFLWENGYIEGASKVKFGNNVSVNRGYLIDGFGTVTIGNNVMIGPNVTIYSTNHIFSQLNTLICNQGMTEEPVVIEDDIWIGANCIILGGVIIGKGAVIGAGSIVTRNIEPYSVNVGVPSKIIYSRQS